ncbi:MAG: hypothetical protein KME35_00930 [Aphanocapsa sp. GSE-SYN-MK-11-07L]|nr:hypothetical protein [Aphanocapsa sp. GSE-SYN-MK-11-07L]
MSNQIKGQTSERTTVWDAGQIIIGAIAIGLSILLAWQGVVKLSQPVVPKVCTAFLSFDEPPSVQRSTSAGCKAAEKKDYQTALAQFRQAAKQTKQGADTYYTSFERSLDQAVKQMEQQTGTTR